MAKYLGLVERGAEALVDNCLDRFDSRQPSKAGFKSLLANKFTCSDMEAVHNQDGMIEDERKTSKKRCLS